MLNLLPWPVALLSALVFGVLSTLLIVRVVASRRRAGSRSSWQVVERHLVEGAQARSAGQLQLAIQHHTHALELADGHTGALLALAEDYHALGEPDMVREHLRRILSRHPDEPRALRWLRDLTVAEGRWEEAVPLQERLTRRASTAEAKARGKGLLAGIRYEVAKAARAEGRTRDARRLFQAVIRDDPGFVPGYLGLGDVLQTLGRARDAVRTWEAGLERTSALPLLHRLERYEREAGHPGEMIDRAQRALARMPDDPTLTFYLGQVYLELSMLDEATEQFERLAALAPGIATFHAHLGSLLERRGKIAEAVSEYSEALRIRGVFELPHRCGECGTFSAGWADRCDRCGSWNSVRSVTRALGPLSPPPPPHGGRRP